MEAVKCPNCGNEKVQELTEEKYVCLACDSIFLVHNLSKEFRKTDEHISEVHSDLSRKLDEIKHRSNNNSAAIQEYLLNAEEELKHGDELEAYREFKRYSTLVPESSVGYEGMFRALTEDYAFNAGECDVLDDSTTMDNLFDSLHDGFDTLKKALECEDCQKDNILSKSLEFYKKSAKSLLAQFILNRDETQEEDSGEVDLHEYLKEFMGNYQQEIEDEERKMEFVRSMIEDIKNPSKSKVLMFEKVKPLLPSLLLLIILPFVGGFLRIVLIVALVIAVFKGCSEVYDNMDFYTENAQLQLLEYYQEKIDSIKSVVDAFNKIETLDIHDMESLICNEWDKGCSAEQLYQQYYENVQGWEEEQREEEQRQAELLEGYYCVELTNWGSRPKEARDILMEYCDSDDSYDNYWYVREQYKNREVCRINNFRKLQAYELQDKLIQCGAVVNVHQM